MECVGVFVAIALSVVISVVMEGRSAKAFEALSKINADMAVRAVRDGQTVTLQSAHLAVGDVVLLSAGDKAWRTDDCWRAPLCGWMNPPLPARAFR